MNKNVAVAVVGALVGALVVAIYFTMVAPAPKAGPCSGGHDPHCRIVSVIPVGAGAQIQLISNVTVITPRDIIWEMDDDTIAAGYIFPADGINFYPSPPKSSPHQAPANEFKDCWPMPRGATNPKKFKCTNSRNNSGTWGYTVSVQLSSPTPAPTPPLPPPLDPYVINR